MAVGYSTLSETVLQFLDVATDSGVIDGSGSEVMRRGSDPTLNRTPETIASASLKDLSQLLTMICRANRFVEGNLLTEFEQGTIVRILERAADLYNGNDHP